MNGIPATAASLDAMDLRQLQGLRTAARGDDPQALRKTAQQFEALFTQMMLKSMRDALPGDHSLGSQGEFYQGMYDQQLSLSLSSGKGMGLADLLVQQLTQSRAAAAAPGDGATPSLRQLSLPASLTSRAAAHRDGSAGDGAWPPRDAQDFIDQIRPHAERAAKALGVPARAIMAQAALETGWGQHISRDATGKPSYNLFGIKASRGWTGERVNTATQEYRDGAFNTERADFRAYDSLAASFDDYVSFLQNNPRYLDALRADSVQGFAHGLQKAGYATDPHYAGKIVDLAYGRNISEALAQQAAPTLQSL